MKYWAFQVKEKLVFHPVECDQVCQWLATGWWFSPGPPVSSTNKTDRHDITEILLKVAFNAIKQTTSNGMKTFITIYDTTETNVFTIEYIIERQTMKNTFVFETSY